MRILLRWNDCRTALHRCHWLCIERSMLNPYNACVGPLSESEGEMGERMMEEGNEEGSNQSDPTGGRAPSRVKGQTSPEQIDHQGNRRYRCLWSKTHTHTHVRAHTHRYTNTQTHTHTHKHTHTHRHIIMLNPLIYLSTILNVCLFIFYLFSFSLCLSGCLSVCLWSSPLSN